MIVLLVGACSGSTTPAAISPTTTCDPACTAGMHCEQGSCVVNVCSPACAPGDRCMTHGTSECACVGEGCETTTVDGCGDGQDNDGDGWVDAADPDCDLGSEETGSGVAGCNDGKDNDGDGLIDVDDPQCDRGDADEVLGSGLCADACVLDQTDEGAACSLWDAARMTWVEAAQMGHGQMHNRARGFLKWLRTRMLPAGGVARAYFNDAELTDLKEYGGESDSAIWTGTYLAAESLRYMVTRSPDALAQVKSTVQTLHHWWNVAGDPGVLARWAAPTTSAPDVVATFFTANAKDHHDVPYNNELWHWRGRVSRDQYQGVMHGMSLAYEATDDPQTRALIREDVVEFVETLMRPQKHPVQIKVDGLAIPFQLETELVLFWDDEDDSGVPTIDIDTKTFEIELHGMLDFWANPAPALRQVPLLAWLPDIPLPTQAVQVASHFLVALQVTEGVPEYAARRQAIEAYYKAHVDDWLDVAVQWGNTQTCGQGYFGNNIVFQPMFNLARLETDPQRAVRVRQQILRDRLWAYVAEHKNVYFAYIYAAHAPPTEDVSPIVAAHTAQLDLFPTAPYIEEACDLRGLYEESSECPGKTIVATDLNHRCHETFIWQKDPWEIEMEAGRDVTLLPGVDYLVAYWLGRHLGFVDEDAPDTCLQWRGGGS